MMRKKCSTVCSEASKEHPREAEEPLGQIGKEQVDKDFQESENSSSPPLRWSRALVQEICKLSREEIQKN